MIGSGATSVLPNMDSIGELFMDGYISFGKRSKRLVCEEKPWCKHHGLQHNSWEQHLEVMLFHFMNI